MQHILNFWEKRKVHRLKTQKEICLWLVGLWVCVFFFFLLLCTLKYLAPVTLKPSPKKSTEMEFQKVAPCQKYSQLSHFCLEQHDLSITFQCWILSFHLHVVGWDAGGSMAWILTMQHRSLEPWALWPLPALHESPLSQARQAGKSTHRGWHPGSLSTHSGEARRECPGRRHSARS